MRGASELGPPAPRSVTIASSNRIIAREGYSCVRGRKRDDNPITHNNYERVRDSARMNKYKEEPRTNGPRQTAHQPSRRGSALHLPKHLSRCARAPQMAHSCDHLQVTVPGHIDVGDERSLSRASPLCTRASPQQTTVVRSPRHHCARLRRTHQAARPPITSQSHGRFADCHDCCRSPLQPRLRSGETGTQSSGDHVWHAGAECQSSLLAFTKVGEVANLPVAEESFPSLLRVRASTEGSRRYT